MDHDKAARRALLVAKALKHHVSVIHNPASIMGNPPPPVARYGMMAPHLAQIAPVARAEGGFIDPAFTDADETAQMKYIQDPNLAMPANQVDQDIEGGAYADGGEVSPFPGRQVAPSGLYSQGAEAAAALPQAKGSPQQFKSTLMSPKYNVKPAEFQNSGFDEAFAGRPSVTRDEVAQHFQNAMPQVEETVLGVQPKGTPYPEEYKNIEAEIMNRYAPEMAKHHEVYRDTSNSQSVRNEAHRNVENLRTAMMGEVNKAIPDRQAALDKVSPKIKPTKFDEYTLPGGENYREVLLKYAESPEEKMERAKSYVRPDIWERMTEDQRQQYLATPDKGLFQSSHWRDDPNVLAHLRLADRTGPNGEKILHVEEIQSDWGQKGKKEGFRGSSLNNEQEAEYQRLKNLFDGAPDGEMNNQDLSRLIDLGDIRRKSMGVPTAPYVTSTPAWTDLALKRALKEAAEGGYDKMVWTPGAEQAKRYDLSKHIDEVQYSPGRNGTFSVEAYKDNDNVFNKPNASAQEIADTFGKEIADKISNGHGEVNRDTGYNVLSGLDLQTGGEGMKGYYDKIVPKRLQELVKKHDPEVKVGYTDVMLPPKSGMGHNNPPIQAPGITITPKMRESILKGQTAFKRGGFIPPDVNHKYAKGGIVQGGPPIHALHLTSKFGNSLPSAVNQAKAATRRRP